MSGLTGGVTAMLGVLAIIILVLWVLLPFAVFGAKDLLKALLAEQQQTNALLRQLAENSQPKK